MAIISRAERAYNMRKHNNSPDKTSNPLTNQRDYIERVVAARLFSGEYAPFPDGFPMPKHGHGAHVSTLNPELLAYFPTRRNIEKMVPQQIKPGRYLRKYFPHMSDDEIRVAVAGFSPLVIKTYSSWENMHRWYRALDDDGVVSSCMSKDIGYWSHDVHPLMVYHNSDVELAVGFRGDKPVARALYNKKTMEYPMIYGQWEAMYKAMEAAGYTHGSLDGAKINRLSRTTGEPDAYASELLMPYIDGHRPLDRSVNNSTRVDVYDDHVVINENGEHTACDYEGVRLTLRESCTCDRCGDGVDEEATVYVQSIEEHWCDSCFDAHGVSARRYSRGRFVTMTTHDGDDGLVYVDDGTCYADDDSARAAGYVYTTDGDWRSEDDVIYVDDEDEYYDIDQEGRRHGYFMVEDTAFSARYIRRYLNEFAWDFMEGVFVQADSTYDSARLDRVRVEGMANPGMPDFMWDALPVNPAIPADLEDTSGLAA